MVEKGERERGGREATLNQREPSSFPDTCHVCAALKGKNMDFVLTFGSESIILSIDSYFELLLI